MQFRLRTLVLLTAIAPPILWAIFSFFRLPGVLYWTLLTLIALAICAPMIIFRLWLVVSGKK